MSQPTAHRYRSPSWPAATAKPKAVILGLHGFGDYRKAWDEPAQIWAKDGITTYSYDQRGFGGSPTRGRWPGTEALVDDAKAWRSCCAPGIPACRSTWPARAWAARSRWSRRTRGRKSTG